MLEWLRVEHHIDIGWDDGLPEDDAGIDVDAILDEVAARLDVDPRVTHVEAQDDFTVNVTFRTGERRRFDLAPYMGRGVFAALRDRSRFRAVRVVAGLRRMAR